MFPGVEGLQLSEESASSGVSEPVQEKPKESPAHPCTVGSAWQLVDVYWMQQNNVELPAGVPTLQTSDESLSSGLSPESHE